MLSTSLSVEASCVLSRPCRRVLRAGQNDQTADSFPSFRKGGNELQVLCGVGPASCAKSLAVLALKCRDPDAVELRRHVGLCGSRRGWTGVSPSKSCYGPYLKKNGRPSGVCWLKGVWCPRETAEASTSLPGLQWHRGVNVTTVSSCLSRVRRGFLWRCRCLGWNEEALQMHWGALCTHPLLGSPGSCSHRCVPRRDGETPPTRGKTHLREGRRE